MSERKSTEERILQGTFRKSRDYEAIDAEQPRIDLPEPSSILGEVGKAKYNELGAKLEEQGLIRNEVDVQYLELYCVNYEMAQSCEAIIESVGGLAEYMKGKNSQNAPELTTLLKARTAMKNLLTALRQGKIIRPKEKQDEDPMKKILMRK